MRSSTPRWPRGECGGCFSGGRFAATGVGRGVGLSRLWSKAVLCKELMCASVRCDGGRPPSAISSCLPAGVSTSMGCDFESASFPLTVDRPGVSPLGSVRTRLTTSGRGMLLRGLEQDIRTYLDRITDLSMVDLDEDGALDFSVPFSDCAWVREADGVDLSPDGSVAFFLSFAGGAETGVDGRGEGAAVFC